MNSIKRFLGEEKGATAVEYALIISLIILAMLASLSNVASSTTGMWNNVADEVSGT